MSDLIPPRPLRVRRTAEGAAEIALPLPIRWRARRRGYALVFWLGGTISRNGRFVDRSGRPLGPATLEPGTTGAFVPKGAVALLLPDAPTDLTIGYFPRTKVELKLHAFAAGRFAPSSVLKRWKAATIAARDLRGLHGALLQAGPAHAQEQAAFYRAYRARFVEDFATVPPKEAAPPLAFISAVTAAADVARVAVALAGQSDGNWQWVILHPEGAPPVLPPSDARIRLVAHAAPEGPEAFNAASALVPAALVAPLDPHGTPTRDAVAMIRAAFAAHPGCALLYTDEERLDETGTPVDGLFKPAFNRHLLRSLDYVGALRVFSPARLAEIGGARAHFGAAWAYDLLLRATEPLDPARILHLPRVAFSRPPEMGDGTFAPHVVADAAAALKAATGVAEVEATAGRLQPVYPLPEDAPLVSFVIPTRDRADLLGLALRSMIALTRYRNFEIVVVDNGSVEPATFALFEEIKAAWPRTVIVRDDGGFNYPRICNLGVEAASGSLISLLNNDIEVVEPGWLDEMVALAALPGTGVVGAKLLFPDRSIQHAGVICGLFDYAAHWFAHADQDEPGYQGRLHSRQNLSAVTAACLLISRACWETIGPLDAERFAEDCNDIDLCLRAVAAGYELVWTPFACLIHHESASRGKRRSKAHRERLKAQRRRFVERWRSESLIDPHYNPNLRRKSLYAALAKAPEGPREARTCAVPKPLT